MRKEFTEYFFIGLGLAAGIFVMIGAMFAMIVIFFHMGATPPFFVSFAIFAFGAVLTAAAAAIPWLHKHCKSDPDIIIDDAGLLFRTVVLQGHWWPQSGELMPWSEIQSIELGPYGRGEGIYVLWRGQRFCHVLKGVFVDRDGKSFWRVSPILKEINATWDRCRNGSPVTEP
jgi:hypothetical protein